MSDKHEQHAEVRRNDDGTIDEVLLYVDGKCVFHMEQMSKKSWYFGLYLQDEIEQFSVSSKTRVHVRSY